jgi:ABC-type polysaccharide/polyol phosphate export permease
MSVSHAIYLAWSDTRARYKKSVLGPLWLTITNLVGILGLSVVWASLLKQDMPTFVPSLTIGLIIWQLLSGSLNEGATTFIRHAGVLKNFPVPPSLFIMRTLIRQLINFAHNIFIIFGVILYYKLSISVSDILTALFNLLILILNIYWMIFFLAIAGSRYRDIEYLLATLLPLLFFVSPIIFRLDHLPMDINIIWLNPLSYFIEIIRMPLLGIEIPFFIKQFVLIYTLAGSLITYVLYRLNRKKIAFWI